MDLSAWKKSSFLKLLLRSHVIVFDESAAEHLVCVLQATILFWFEAEKSTWCVIFAICKTEFLSSSFSFMSRWKNI